MTSWAPIGLTLLLTSVLRFSCPRRKRNGTTAVSTGLLMLALASFALVSIATAAFFWGGALLLAALAGFAISARSIGT